MAPLTLYAWLAMSVIITAKKRTSVGINQCINPFVVYSMTELVLFVSWNVFANTQKGRLSVFFWLGKRGNQTHLSLQSFSLPSRMPRAKVYARCFLGAGWRCSTFRYSILFSKDFRLTCHYEISEEFISAEYKHFFLVKSSISLHSSLIVSQGWSLQAIFTPCQTS